MAMVRTVNVTNSALLISPRIFILEGLLTAVVGVLMKWWLVDWPADAKFLTPEERQVLLARLKVDRSEEATMDRWNTKLVVGDFKIWVGMLMFFGIVNVSLALGSARRHPIC
jgi:hypothetical protein